MKNEPIFKQLYPYLFNFYRDIGVEDRYGYFEILSRAHNVDVMNIILKAEQLGPEQDLTQLVDWVLKQRGTIRQRKNKYKRASIKFNKQT